MNVPFGDLHSQYLGLKNEIDAAISEVIHTSSFIRGPQVEKFEREFAEAVKSSKCISCGNGTDALIISLKALGLKSGDEVIVPAHTWISTAEAVTAAGGKVVFADTDLDTFTISPQEIVAKITPQTVGIIPVHLYGQAADMSAIMSIASSNNLWVVEDCAQAHLAEYQGTPVGSYGDFATYSFYPGKNLGAMGDAGAITTNSESLALLAAKIARHGGLVKGQHEVEGLNSRLDSIQAAILSIKLKHLQDWTLKRRQQADYYNRLFYEHPEISTPAVKNGNQHSWHLYVVKLKDRDLIRQKLIEKGIQTIVSYPVALPFVPAYSRYNYTPSMFPNAFTNQSSILSLPLYPEMTEDQQAYVAEALIKAVEKT